MSFFAQIQENVGEPFQTKPLGPSDFRRIAVVVAAIEEHFIEPSHWEFFWRKGSITRQHRQDDHLVIKVFIDFDNRLAEKIGLGIHRDPTVVGIEMTRLDPFVREALRDALAGRFAYYVDPRKQGNSKWWLQPIDNHFYDVLFLGPGDCELGYSEDRVNKILEVASITEGAP